MVKKITKEKTATQPEFGNVVVVKNEVEIAEEVVETKKKSPKDSVSVCSKDGQVVRVYSVEDHGDDFYKLAEEFASKRNFSLK